MDPRRVPIDNLWIEDTLKPFLRYAFSQILTYDTDISPVIHSAIEFCMNSPDDPTDGDDLLFERVFLAINHRDRSHGDDLNPIIDDLESLARFLIRRQQLNGPYELEGRTIGGSDAWREFQAQRHEGLRQTNNRELRGNSGMGPPRTRSTMPIEMSIDPRLVHAQPGQFTAPNLPRTLTAVEDQYFRAGNNMLEERQRRMMPTSQHMSFQQAASQINYQPNVTTGTPRTTSTLASTVIRGHHPTSNLSNPQRQQINLFPSQSRNRQGFSGPAGNIHAAYTEQSMLPPVHTFHVTPVRGGSNHRHNRGVATPQSNTDGNAGRPSRLRRLSHRSDHMEPVVPPTQESVVARQSGSPESAEASQSGRRGPNTQNASQNTNSANDRKPPYLLRKR